MIMFSRIINKAIRIFVLFCRIQRIKILGVKMGKGAKIWGRIRIEGIPQNISFGDNCSINHGVLLEAGDYIHCGNNVTISAYCQIHTSYLGIDDWPNKNHYRKPVIIGNNVWIASCVIIQSGVEICDNVIVGANSVVLRTLREEGFYAGIPAKKIRDLKK